MDRGEGHEVYDQNQVSGHWHRGSEIGGRSSEEVTSTLKSMDYLTIATADGPGLLGVLHLAVLEAMRRWREPGGASQLGAA